jgi:hypothetical protein
MEFEESEEVYSLLEKQPAGRPTLPSTSSKDRIFALAFAVNLGITCFIAIFFGLPNVSSIYFTVHHDIPSSTETSTSHGLKIFSILLIVSCLCGGISALWLHILQNYASQVIHYTLKLSIGIFSFMGLLAFVDSGMGGRAIGFVNIFLALLVSFYYLSIRNALEFAASNLTSAARILKSFPGLLSIAYFAIIVQIIWIIIWNMAVVGVLAIAVKNRHDSTTYGNMCFIFMLLSLFWVIQVVKNTVHCITAGAVGEWWYGVFDAHTIQRSKQRSLSSSFGSICFVSLILAALNTLQALLTTARKRASMLRQRHKSTNACLEVLVRVVTKGVERFNVYTFCQVAIYGKDFRTAGRDVWQLFRQRGWTMVVNDTLLSGVLAVGCLVVGATSGVIGSSWMYLALRCTATEKTLHPEQCETFNVVMLTFMACAAIGYAMCGIVSSILESIVATIFVCFAEDPRALETAHPVEHARLVTAWKRLRPDLMVIPGHTTTV